MFAQGKLCIGKCQKLVSCTFTKSLVVLKYIYKTYIQVGSEPTDTFQMVIYNIWKQRKISENVYKYVQVCYLLPIDYKRIF